MDDSEPFTIDGVEFVPSWLRRSRPGSLTLLKSVDMVARYRDLLAPFSEANMVELGISQGGSVALLALLVRPQHFVAVELDTEPVQPLLQVLEEHGLGSSVRPHFGVDQADREHLTRILDDEFGPAELDVVIDDASHLLVPTIASFEVLFPRLRPGGLYVIEDWTWQDLWAHRLAAVLEDPSAPGHDVLAEGMAEQLRTDGPPDRPLSAMALDLLLARAESGDAVAEVVLDESWIVVRRGDAPLDRGTFRWTDLHTDHFSLLAGPP